MLNASLLIFIVSALAAILGMAGMTIIAMTPPSAQSSAQSRHPTQKRLFKAMRIIAVTGILAALASGASITVLQGLG